MDINKLKTGDLLLCHADRWISRIIQYVTGSYWTHTANFVWLDNIALVIEAQADGVHMIRFDEWQRKYNYEFIVYRPKKLESVWLGRALSKIGVAGYDFVSFITKHPWHILTGKWKRRSNEYDRMVCSEFSAWTYGIDEAYKYTPVSMALYVVEHSWEKIDLNV